jgi:hypothetical protein
MTLHSIPSFGIFADDNVRTTSSHDNRAGVRIRPSKEKFQGLCNETKLYVFFSGGIALDGMRNLLAPSKEKRVHDRLYRETLELCHACIQRNVRTATLYVICSLYSSATGEGFSCAVLVLPGSEREKSAGVYHHRLQQQPTTLCRRQPFESV